MGTRDYSNWVKDILITDIYGIEYEAQATLDNACGCSEYVDFYDMNEYEQISIKRSEIEELVVL
tara:strand:- start:808 stop:999 length:192 start_codon:yes stop_codon:yes gene_type:complete